MSNATGKKNDPVYHNEGADHPASDAGEKAGQKRISHKLKLESFKHLIKSYQVFLPRLQLDCQFCLDNLSLE
jgi:hypothetical protein